MAIPTPSQENYPSAFVAWRLYEPTDSRVKGLAIVTDEKQTYWLVNYTKTGKRFPEPNSIHISKVRAILQSKLPINCKLHQVSVLLPCKASSCWQAKYSIQNQLTAVAQSQAILNSLPNNNLTHKVTVDKQTEIIANVELTNQSQDVVDNTSKTSINTVYSNKLLSKHTGTFTSDCTVKDKLETVKFIKTKARQELIKPVGKTFISLKHKNKFFAMLRIASKNIISKVTNNIENNRKKEESIYGKGSTIYHKKASYNACPPPPTISVNSNIKYFDKTDLAAVIAMGIIYDNPEKYVAGNYEYYKEQVHVWAKGTLIKHGIPIFSQEEGRVLFPLVLKRTGLSDAEIQSIKISTHAVMKSLFVTV